MKFYIETYGCSRNQADSEAIAGALAEEHEQVAEAEEADIVVVNTCIVKTPTENKVLKALKKYSDKKLIVAGCMPAAQLDKVKEAAPGCEVWGVGCEEDLASPRIRTNPIVSIIPISSGCLGECSYCCVRFARGKLKSYSPEKIVGAVEKSVSEGCKEIWITAQDTGAYGKDIGTSLPALLEKICEVSGDFRVRIGMMNPNHAVKMLPSLVKALQNEKMFKFLHLPVQSGSNEVLKKMNRYYTVSEYKEIIEFVRKEIPQIMIATDVITGFPGETDAQFEETVELMKAIEPDIINVSRYGARPGTPAAEMEQHQEIVKKERSREMVRVMKEIGLKRKREWLDWEGEVMIETLGSKNDYIARNFAYQPVILKGKHELGDKVNVKISNATENYLLP